MSLRSGVRGLLFLAWAQLNAQYVINTFAGGGAPQGVPATSVGISDPQSLMKDSVGNLYIVAPNRVYKVDVTGILTTVAGNGTFGCPLNGGPVLEMSLGNLRGLAIDRANNIFISDSDCSCIWKVVNGVMSKFAGVVGSFGYSGDGGPAGNARLWGPAGLAFDSLGSLYIADANNNRVRKVTNGVISTVAGIGTGGFGGDGGPATTAFLKTPIAVALDASDNLYISDNGNGVIRKVANGVITRFAGVGPGFGGDGGPATAAGLLYPSGIAVDVTGNLFIADLGNRRVRKVSQGVITTVAGNGQFGFSGDGGTAIAASMSSPGFVAIDNAGDLYIADGVNNRVREVTNGVINTVVGNGTGSYSGDGIPAATAVLASPGRMATDGAGAVYFVDAGNNRIRRIANGKITTVATASCCLSGVAVDSHSNVYYTEGAFVRAVLNGVITTVAGNGDVAYSADGVAATSTGVYPLDVAVDRTGNVYIADSANNRVRKVSDGVITTIAGNGVYGFSGDGGPATAAPLKNPSGVAFDSAGSVYILDSGNNRIRKVINGTINTIGGNGVQGYSGDGGYATAASVNPSEIATDSAGSLYMADSTNRVRKISGGIISTITGTGVPGYSGDGAQANAALLSFPEGITADAIGNVYVADSGNNRIRILSPIGLGNPIGSFDTPLDNTTGVAGAIPVTGWALDNVGISKVQVWREPVGNEPVASNNLVFVGDAVQVAGARPDVQKTFPNMPFNDRAGWGYQLLTNFLPGVAGALGNGSYKLHFIAYNNAGGQTDLGTRTITVDNAHALKPFGTIDTPGQGDTISGNAYVNFGWALTQNPYCIPNDGHTLNVFIDGMMLGHPTYNQKRSDIATLFPGLCNSNGGVGFFYIDTTQFANGLHTISWTATDSQGHTDGLGSRYFTTQNSGGAAAPEESASESVKTGPSHMRRSSYAIEVEELDRIELDLGAISSDSLPVGSTLKDGVFYWQLGPGFLGDYEFRFTRLDGTSAVVHVKIHPKSYARN
jgi:sugar lactone lactonase YvrE